MNFEPLYSNEVVTPGWEVFAGAGGSYNSTVSQTDISQNNNILDAQISLIYTYAVSIICKQT